MGFCAEQLRNLSFLGKKGVRCLIPMDGFYHNSFLRQIEKRCRESIERLWVGNKGKCCFA